MVFTHELWTLIAAGSGAFIAPGLGLTAKPVAQGFEHLDPQFDALARRRSPLDDQYSTTRVETDFATMVYQMATYKVELVSWHSDVGWGSSDADIATLVVRPESEPQKRQHRNCGTSRGSCCRRRSGRPCGSTAGRSRRSRSRRTATFRNRHDHEWTVELHVEPGWVEEIIYVPQLYRPATFPCFRIRTKYPKGLAHGMSGGAVVYNGRLCGVFSGPNLLACLWPLTLMDYPISKEENAPHASYVEHFESGSIDTSYDWNEVEGRVRRLPCKEIVAGTEAEPCEKSHAALASCRENVDFRSCAIDTLLVPFSIVLAQRVVKQALGSFVEPESVRWRHPLQPSTTPIGD